MNPNDVDEKAQEILKNNYVIAPPVNVREIVENEGLEVIEMPFKDEINNVSGYIDTEKGRIYVNTADSKNRRNFTLAHELGHWLMHRKKLQEDPDKYAILYRIAIGKANDDPIEKQANRFAAELLVPQEIFKKYYAKYKDDIEKLSNLFQVSQEVIGYRIKDLNLDHA